jgi:hypothetical protein
MKLITFLTPLALQNFYQVHGKIMSLFGFRDAYFIYQKQRIYISGLPSDFFNGLINWVGMQASVIVFTYVAYVDSMLRNTYTQFGAYFTDTAVWFLPFNFYSNGLIYWDSASQVRSGNNYFNILACEKFIVAPVKERNDKVLTGGDTLVVYDQNGNIVPPKSAPNGQLYPAQTFYIKNPENLQGLLFTFVNNVGSIQYQVDDPAYCNYKITGNKNYKATDEKSFNIGLPLWRDDSLPYTINQRTVVATNLDYIQSFEDAFCGATIVAFPTNEYLSPYIPNSAFQASQIKNPQTINNPLQYQSTLPYTQYELRWLSKNSVFKLLICPSPTTVDKWTLITSTSRDKNNNIYDGTSVTITATLKDYNQIDIQPPKFFAYQFAQQDGLILGQQQGYYDLNNQIISSNKYICFNHTTDSSNDLYFFQSTQTNLAFDVIFNGQYLVKGVQAMATQDYGLPISAQIFINLYKLDNTTITVSEYASYFSDKALNYIVYMEIVDFYSATSAIAQISTQPDYSPLFSTVYYRTNFPSLDIKLLWLMGGIVYQIKQITDKFQDLALIPLSAGKFMIIINAKSNEQAVLLSNILSNPGDYPLLVDNLPSYDNQDVLNIQRFPNLNEKDLYSKLVSQSNYSAYTSGYYGDRLNWVISKFTKGIIADNVNNCNVNVLNTTLNTSYYQTLKEFSSEGPLPFEFLITSKTIRNGIRMFNQIFNHDNNLEREIIAYTSIMIKPNSWTYDPTRNLYMSNRFLWPQLWPKFKYGAFIGFTNIYSRNYSTIYTDLERIIYYVPKPFTLRTATDTYILCREIELRNQFIIECDKELDYVLFLVSNHEGRATRY